MSASVGWSARLARSMLAAADAPNDRQLLFSGFLVRAIFFSRIVLALYDGFVLYHLYGSSHTRSSPSHTHTANALHTFDSILEFHGLARQS